MGNLCGAHHTSTHDIQSSIKQLQVQQKSMSHPHSKHSKCNHTIQQHTNSINTAMVNDPTTPHYINHQHKHSTIKSTLTSKCTHTPSLNTINDIHIASETIYTRNIRDQSESSNLSEYRNLSHRLSQHQRDHTHIQSTTNSATDHGNNKLLLNQSLYTVRVKPPLQYTRATSPDINTHTGDINDRSIMILSRDDNTLPLHQCHDRTILGFLQSSYSNDSIDASSIHTKQHRNSLNNNTPLLCVSPLDISHNRLISSTASSPTTNTTASNNLSSRCSSEPIELSYNNTIQQQLQSTVDTLLSHMESYNAYTDNKCDKLIYIANVSGSKRPSYKIVDLQQQYVA